MKTNKKVIRGYDKKQKGYQASMNHLTPKQALGYRKPGSMNPRKNGAQVDMIKKKTIAEIEDENKWWLSLSREEQEIILQKMADDDNKKNTTKLLVTAVLLTVYAIFALIPIIALIIGYTNNPS